ncbi:hypothetical protein KV557_24610 [Kitasatospora aureofaciens]|uniref:hypothetical protein n=1 Tax=Kitasatospora aureofaciens TaxID=1894 RepID=UPI001C443531|nr:hypothetical protein [Kitasatospora aureofaciens]MBV6700247.1 hypothetical protein [Kitasatospora aureofaciens]
MANKNSGAMTVKASLRPYVNGRMRLPKGQENAWAPKPFEVGDWIEWTPDEEGAEPIRGCVWSPGAHANRWFVWTDRSATTGEYHVLTRNRRRDGSYSYSVSGGGVPRSLGQAVPDPVPTQEGQELPRGATVAPTPIPYAQWRDPAGHMQFPVPPVELTVHHRQAPMGGPLPFLDVTVNGSPYVLRLDRADNGIELFHVETAPAQGESEELAYGVESRASAVGICVRHYRQNHPEHEAAAPAGAEPQISSARVRTEQGTTTDFWTISVNGAEYSAHWTGPSSRTFTVNVGGIADTSLLLGEVEDLDDAKAMAARHAAGDRAGLLERIPGLARGWRLALEDGPVYLVTPTDNFYRAIRSDSLDNYRLTFGDEELGSFKRLKELTAAARAHAASTPRDTAPGEVLPVAEPTADNVPLFDLAEPAAEPDKPQVRVRRVFTASEVKRRWTEGKTSPLWRRPPRTLSGGWPDPATPRLERAQARLGAESASQHNSDNAELSPLARFLIGRSSTKWYVYHCASGLLMNQGAGYSSKREAVAWATELEQVKNGDGTWFEWDIDYLADELRLHESRARLNELLAGPDAAPTEETDTAEEAQGGDAGDVQAAEKTAEPAPAANEQLNAAVAPAVVQAGSAQADGPAPEPKAGEAEMAVLPEGAEPTADESPFVVLPDGALPVDGFPGYHYLQSARMETTVYGPDNEPVARGRYVGDGVTAGLVDGVRIAAGGYGSARFHVLAAAQHRAAQLPPEQQDRVWVEIVPDATSKTKRVIVVRGTVRDDAPDERATKAGNLYWSGEKKAKVSGRNWTAKTVDQNVAAVLSEFARQGRAVVVRRPGSSQDASTPIPAAAVPAPRQPEAVPAQAPAAEPGVETLSDKELAEAIRETSARVGYGIQRDERAAERAAVLETERQERVLRRIAAAPEVTGMTDAELAAEHQWLVLPFAHNAFAYKTEGDLVVKARTSAVSGEEQARKARTLLAGPAAAELDDEKLGEAYAAVAQLHLHMPRSHELRGSMQDLQEGLRGEMAARRVRHYEQRPAVGEMLLKDLATESAELTKGSEDPAISGREEVDEARTARLGAVEGEMEGREAAKYPDELARAQVSTSRRTSYREVKVDGMPDMYGSVDTAYGGQFEARVGWERQNIGRFPSRPAAVAALVRHYDENPRTLPQRTWGVPREVVLPIGARDEVLAWLRRRTREGGTPERQRLVEILERTPTQQPRRNPVTGKTMRAYEYRVEEGLLGELSRVAEQATAELRERGADPEVPQRDREAAKRRIPAMGAALMNVNGQRDRLREAGRDTDRRGVDASQVAAQLAALAGSVEGSSEDGDSGDGESVQLEGPAALGAVPAQGAGRDAGPGGVLREEGPGAGERGDRGRGGAGGGDGAGGQLPGAGGPAEPDPGASRGAGDGGAAAAAGGRGGGPGSGAERDPGRAGLDLAGPERAVGPFRPDPADIPRGPLARAAANLEAIRVLRRLEAEHTGASAEDKRVLARWSGWGSVPVVFLERPDEKNPAYGPGGEREGRYEKDLTRWEEYSPVRAPLRELLDPFEWNAASRATLSAHYTPQALARAMWEGLRAFGFDGGEVLEAGSGSGVFFGAAPEGVQLRLTGIELDPTTARICQYIYPHANVLAESFADTDAPAGAFDAAIGNVPFAQVPFTERRYGATGHSLHNGFLIKELALTREGGYVLGVTSRWTLDAEDDSARRQMARYGDLVAAYRLPGGVFGETAGTGVVVDVLVLRRRPDGEAPGDQGWLDAPKREVNDSTHTINRYFEQHPEHVLGQLTTTSGPYGPAVTVLGDPAGAIEQLRTELAASAAQALAQGRGYQPHPQGIDRRPLNLMRARDKHANDYTGRLYRDGEGRIWQHVNGGDPVEAIPSDGNTGQLVALMEMRTVAAELKELDRTGDEAPRAEELRGRLRQLHSAYTQAHGPLSQPRQTRLAATPEVRARAAAEGREVRDDERTPTAWGWFRADPDAATVLGLETWDRKAGAAVLSEVLTRRPGSLRGELERTDDPAVALAAVMSATGQVDLDRIAELLGTDPAEARLRLGTSVFDNPATGKLEHAGIYLTGAVRKKLATAREAAVKDPAFAVNVTALQAVQPREKRIGDFTPQLGAHWIPAPLVQGFLREYLSDPTLRVDHNERYGWSLYPGKVPPAIDALKGTPRRPAAHIARALLGRGSLVVEDTFENDQGKVVTEVNDDATRAARQKADQMRSAFEAYLTADSGRVAQLTDAYNEVMNGHVVRNYDTMRPSLAGFTPERTPYWYQLGAAARMQFERGVILDHEVGLGKTTTFAMGTQALKASGQISKPFLVMQRHLAQQLLDEASMLYPHADIRLITSDMLNGDQRRATLEWLRSNSPDLTLFTEGAFLKVKMSPEYQEQFEFREVQAVREQVLRERGVPNNALAVIKLEQRLATLEARLRRNAAPMRTPGELYWEDLGFDYAVIDEAHRFRGLGFRSKEGGGDPARLRGIDLHQKLSWMHQVAGEEGGRPTVTLATGTPLNKSISEQYGMLALAAPWVLDEFGVGAPDLWAGTYGVTVPRIEMAPDGSGLKVVERFSRFVNKSAMKTMWGLVADCKTADEVGLPRPSVAGGGPRLILIEPTADQQARLKKLMARGAAIHSGEVTRQQDNMLNVGNDGRAIALDPRLLDADAPAGGKLAAAADLFAARYHANKDRAYTVSTRDSTPHPRRGGLQVGFLNAGTPGGKNKGNFNAYAELRRLMVERGVPEEKIAFVQEHNHSPESLGELFRGCREGEVSVLLGSTETLGTGANVQNRNFAVTHIDLDWNASGMRQRNGRGIRQGNQHDVVEIDILATLGSMDSWQAALLASKAEGLDDMRRPDNGDDTTDTVQEIGEGEWDYATMQAEIGGNPYLGQLMEARQHLAGLEADRRNYAADRLLQAELLATTRAEAEATREGITRREAALPQIDLSRVRGDDFAIQLGQSTHTERRTAGPALRQATASALMEHRTPGTGPWRVVGRFGGLPVGVQAEMTATGQMQIRVGFPDLRKSEALYSVQDLTGERIGTTMLGRLATALEKAPDQQVLDREALPGLESQIALLSEQQAAVDFGERIDHARRRTELLDDVVAAIAERDKLPELTVDDLDPARYGSVETREREVNKRAEERKPLQAKIDQAVGLLEAFDRDHPAPLPPDVPSLRVSPDGDEASSRPSRPDAAESASRRMPAAEAADRVADAARSGPPALGPGAAAPAAGEQPATAAQPPDSEPRQVEEESSVADSTGQSGADAGEEAPRPVPVGPGELDGQTALDVGAGALTPVQLPEPPPEPVEPAAPEPERAEVPGQMVFETASEPIEATPAEAAAEPAVDPVQGEPEGEAETWQANGRTMYRGADGFWHAAAPAPVPGDEDYAQLVLLELADAWLANSSFEFLNDSDPAVAVAFAAAWTAVKEFPHPGGWAYQGTPEQLALFGTAAAATAEVVRWYAPPAVMPEQHRQDLNELQVGIDAHHAALLALAAGPESQPPAAVDTMAMAARVAGPNDASPETLGPEQLPEPPAGEANDATPPREEASVESASLDEEEQPGLFSLGVAVVPVLDVEAPDLTPPQLGPAEPHDNASLNAAIQALTEAYGRWDRLPLVGRYVDQDNLARPGGFGDPINPVAALRHAYLRVINIRPPVPGGPSEVLATFYAPAAWARVLRPAVPEELREALDGVESAALRLSAGFQAALAAAQALAAEPAPLQEEAAVSDQAPVEQEATSQSEAGAVIDPAPAAPVETLVQEQAVPNAVSPDTAEAEAGPVATAGPLSAEAATDSLPKKESPVEPAVPAEMAEEQLGLFAIGAAAVPAPGSAANPESDAGEVEPPSAGDQQVTADEAAPEPEEAEEQAATSPEAPTEQSSEPAIDDSQEAVTADEDARAGELEAYVRTGRVPAGYASLEEWLGEDAELARAMHEEYMEDLIAEHNVLPEPSVQPLAGTQLVNTAPTDPAASEAAPSAADDEVAVETTITPVETTEPEPTLESTPMTDQIQETPAVPADEATAPEVSSQAVADDAPTTEAALPRTADAPTAPRSAGTPLNGFTAALEEAWSEIVPADHGTVQDLREAMEAPLRALEERWQRTAPLPQVSVPVTGPVTPDAPQRSADPKDPAAPSQPAAEAVSTALSRADEHTSTLKDVPEWQELQTVRGAARNLLRAVRERAGQYADKLFGDGRVQNFFREIGIRAFDTVAHLAQRAADRLRRNQGDLPSADALLALGNAAGAYSLAQRQRGQGGLPSAEALLALGDGALNTANRQRPTAEPTANEVNLPSLQKMGKALQQPLPGQKSRTAGVSAAAAKSRSSTRKGAKKPTPAAGEQAAHLRRGAAETQRTRKPNQR